MVPCQRIEPPEAVSPCERHEMNLAKGRMRRELPVSPGEGFALEFERFSGEEGSHVTARCEWCRSYQGGAGRVGEGRQRAHVWYEAAVEQRVARACFPADVLWKARLGGSNAPTQTSRGYGRNSNMQELKRRGCLSTERYGTGRAEALVGHR